MTNALKAVRTRPVRRIAVEAARERTEIAIRVSDTGVGANKKSWEDYFKPFVSESEPDPLLGSGTGLGLKIVRDFAGVYGGSAHFIPPKSPWSTTIEVRIPDE